MSADVERVARAWAGDLWELFDEDDRHAMCDRIALAMRETRLIDAGAARKEADNAPPRSMLRGLWSARADWLATRAGGE